MTQLVCSHILDVCTVYLDSAARRLIETLEQFGKGALARSRRSHDGNRAAWLDGDVEIVVQERQLVVISGWLTS